MTDRVEGGGSPNEGGDEGVDEGGDDEGGDRTYPMSLRLKICSCAAWGTSCQSPGCPSHLVVPEKA